jgi:hypothetical protein
MWVLAISYPGGRTNRSASTGKNPRPTVVAQLQPSQGHPRAHLRVEYAATPAGEESMTRLAEPQLSFAALELRYQGVPSPYE